MFLDPPNMTASNSQTELDRLGRSSRVDGDVMALADPDARARFVEKARQIHGHKDTLIVVPSDTEKEYFVQARAGRIGDGGDHVEHEL